MFTRLWQHRYSGLLATLLVGLAAAVLVMLLPDRQQAFARFMVDPAIAEGQLGPQSLMNDQRLISRVLQRLEIESPNLIDPRSVDPLTAFERNFGLRPTGTPGEFEISYVSRSSEQAAEGVKTWLSVASDVWSLEGPADSSPSSPVGPVDKSRDVLLAEIEAAKTALAKRRDRQQALSLEQSQLTEQLASARAAKERFEADQTRAASALASRRAARETREAQSGDVITKASAELDSAEQKLGTLQESLAQLSAQAKQAADRLAQVKQAQAQAATALASAQQNLQTAQAAKSDFASAADDRAQNLELARSAQADRQRAAIAEELKQAVERGIMLERRLAQTSPTIVEVVTQKAPIAPTGDYASRQRLIAKTKAELTELRVRFTDNHPDVRRQLAILSDLESPSGTNNVIEAPTVGARPEVRPNPQHAIVKDAVEQNQAQVALLRKRVGEMEDQRKQFAGRQAQATGTTEAEQQNQAQLAQAERALSSAQAAAAGAEQDLQAAEKRVAETRAAQSAQSDAVKSAEVEVAELRTQLANVRQTARDDANPSDANTGAAGEQPSAAQQAETAKQRQALDGKLKSAEQSLASLGLALEENDRQVRQAADSLAARQDTSPETETLGLARGGMTLVQSTQVVPASTSPDRTRFLFFGLLASLVLGILVALALSARRTAFSSVAQLEQATGLRALGGVPRFKTSSQTIGFWISAAWFTLLIIIYGLIYLGFIALVESGSSLLQPDWAVWREAGLGLLRDGAAKIGVGGQWLAGLGENR